MHSAHICAIQLLCTSICVFFSLSVWVDSNCDAVTYMKQKLWIIDLCGDFISAYCYALKLICRFINLNWNSRNHLSIWLYDLRLLTWSQNAFNHTQSIGIIADCLCFCFRLYSSIYHGWFIICVLFDADIFSSQTVCVFF